MNTSKQINIMVLVVFAAVLATGAYTLWDPSRADQAEESQLESTIERGAWLFSQNCRTCHGDVGEGGAAGNRFRAAPPLNGLALGEDATDVEGADRYKLVYYTITCGRVGRQMPSWAQSQGGPLNDEQIKQLTIFILQGGEKGWEEARDFGIHGVPEFGDFGDDQYGLALTEDVSETDTEIPLNKVATEVEDAEGNVVQAPFLVAGERLSIKDENGEDVEIMLIEEVDTESSRVTVERGFGNTEAAAHTSGTEVLKPPVPPDDPPAVERACGQAATAQTPSAPEPPSATLSIIARGTAWNKDTLSAIAGVPLTISVDNQDDGIEHNWAVWQGDEAEGDPLATTPIEEGPVTQNLNFGPLEAGDYYYICEVHPNMEGTLTAYPPGEGPQTGGAGTPAAGTPAAGTPAAGATGTVVASTPAATGTPAP